jgi:HlyD family secretion protein
VSQRNLTGLARADAVRNFASAEQLDQRLVVVRSRSWIFLLMAVAALAIALGWGFLGRVPRFVEGQGVIAPAGAQPVEVDSPFAFGGVIDVLVEEDMKVRAGDPMVRIRNQEIEDAVRTARATLASLQAQDAAMTREEDSLLEKQQAATERQIASAEESMRLTGELVGLLERELADLDDLVQKQLIPRSQLVQARSVLFTSMQQMAQQESMIAQANAARQQLLSTVQQGRLQREQSIVSAQGSLAAAETRLAQSTVVHAPIDGVVISLMANTGSSIRAGEAIGMIRPRVDADQVPVLATCYVPFGAGKQVRAGMPVRISLPFAPPSRYGYVIGEVVWVSEYVAEGSAATYLGSAELAQVLSRSLGAMIEVTVQIASDPATPTGFAWTSRDGYPESVEFPLLCGVQIATREDRPIDLLLPWLKDLLGIDQPPIVPGMPASP